MYRPKGQRPGLHEQKSAKPGLKRILDEQALCTARGKAAFTRRREDTGRRAGFGRRERIGAPEGCPTRRPWCWSPCSLPRDRGYVNVAGCSTKKTMQSILEKAQGFMGLNTEKAMSLFPWMYSDSYVLRRSGCNPQVIYKAVCCLKIQCLYLSLIITPYSLY